MYMSHALFSTSVNSVLDGVIPELMASRHTPIWVMVLHIYKSLFVPFCLESPNTVQHLITIHIIRLCSLVFSVGVGRVEERVIRVMQFNCHGRQGEVEEEV